MMKKLPFYIAVGVAVAAIAALIGVEYRRRTSVVNPDTLSKGEDYLYNQNSFAAQTFKGVNLAQLLSASTPNKPKEMGALQYVINAYYGGTQSIPITSKWDAATAAAVKDITGKSQTNLFEMIYNYLVPQRGEKAATDLLQQFNGNA